MDNNRPQPRPRKRTLNVEKDLSWKRDGNERKGSGTRTVRSLKDQE
jgi:hypothetical protein